MIRFFVVVLMLAVSLYALSDTELLKRANNFVKSANKSDQFRAYNDYKNLYLISLMKENEKLRIEALKGIVKSGKKLHIDVSQYSDELKKYKSKTIT
jgi:N-acetylmuramoyl-L-alanine amidase